MHRLSGRGPGSAFLTELPQVIDTLPHGGELRVAGIGLILFHNKPFSARSDARGNNGRHILHAVADGLKAEILLCGVLGSILKGK